MSTPDIERLSHAEMVLRRPSMWTAEGTLSEILAFLNGYDAATCMGARCQDDSPGKLLDWLAGECGYSRIRQSPAQQVEQIVGHFGSTDLALTALSEQATQLRTMIEGRTKTLEQG